MRAQHFLLAITLTVSACTKSPEPVLVSVPEGKQGVAVTLPTYPDIKSLVRLMNNGESSSVEIVADALSKSKHFEILNAFISLDAEAAVAKAKKMDQKRSTGQLAGPLHGIGNCKRSPS